MDFEDSLEDICQDQAAEYHGEDEEKAKIEADPDDELDGDCDDAKGDKEEKTNYEDDEPADELDDDNGNPKGDKADCTNYEGYEAAAEVGKEGEEDTENEEYNADVTEMVEDFAKVVLGKRNQGIENQEKTIKVELQSTTM